MSIISENKCAPCNLQPDQTYPIDEEVFQYGRKVANRTGNGGSGGSRELFTANQCEPEPAWTGTGFIFSLGPGPLGIPWARAPGDPLGPGPWGSLGPGPLGIPWILLQFEKCRKCETVVKNRAGTFFQQVSPAGFSSRIVLILVGAGDFPYC